MFENREVTEIYDGYPIVKRSSNYGTTAAVRAADDPGFRFAPVSIASDSRAMDRVFEASYPGKNSENLLMKRFEELKEKLHSCRNQLGE